MVKPERVDAIVVQDAGDHATRSTSAFGPMTIDDQIGSLLQEISQDTVALNAS